MTATRRFACTQCGQCCNRPPEVELSEAAALAEIFVFRLMFRLYSLPRSSANYRPAQGNVGDEYFQVKRLVAAFAAHKYPAKSKLDGKVVEHMQYLTISALALDLGIGACGALNQGACGIYSYRPLACQTVPFHYSRTEAMITEVFDSFVASPGYACETSADGTVVIERGRIVDEAVLETRARAQSLANDDRRWKSAIVRAMKHRSGIGLPSMREVEANAHRGVLTTPMHIAWQIAVEAGLMSVEECHTLVAAQERAIGEALVMKGIASEVNETLLQIRHRNRAFLRGQHGAKFDGSAIHAQAIAG